MIEMGYVLSMKYDASRCRQYGPGKQIQHDMRTYTGPSDHAEDFTSSDLKRKVAYNRIRSQ